MKLANLFLSGAILLFTLIINRILDRASFTEQTIVITGG
jgi:hypothetical protein